MRIFLDANVLFSAAKSDGAVRTLVRQLIEDGHQCLADEYVVTEARRNLGAKGADALAVFEALLLHLDVRAASLPASDPAELDWLPEKDRPVLSAAIRSKCEALVTGDKTHFGSGYGKTFGGVTIDSPRSIAERLLR
jgi:predicted nucleic acid-binding protein